MFDILWDGELDMTLESMDEVVAYFKDVYGQYRSDLEFDRESYPENYSFRDYLDDSSVTIYQRMEIPACVFSFSISTEYSSLPGKQG